MLEATMPLHEYVYQPPSALPPTVRTAALGLANDNVSLATCDNVKNNLVTCIPAINLLAHLEETLPHIFQEIYHLEDALLTMATHPKCTEGVFYAIVFQIKDCVVCRYMESGSYQGFFSSKYKDGVMEKYGVDASTLLCLETFTQGDLKEREGLQDHGNGKRERPDMTFLQNTVGNKNSAQACFTRISQASTEDTQLLHIVVHAARTGFKHTVPQHVTSKKLKTAKDHWYV